jgi:hypothetical protein
VKIIARAFSDEEMSRAIATTRAHVGIKIPEDYSRRLLAGQNAEVLVIVDGTVSSVAGEALNVGNALALQESLQRVLGDRRLLRLHRVLWGVPLQPQLPRPHGQHPGAPARHSLSTASLYPCPSFLWLTTRADPRWRRLRRVGLLMEVVGTVAGIVLGLALLRLVPLGGLRFC